MGLSKQYQLAKVWWHNKKYGKSKEKGTFKTKLYCELWQYRCNFLNNDIYCSKKEIGFCRHQKKICNILTRSNK